MQGDSSGNKLFFFESQHEHYQTIEALATSFTANLDTIIRFYPSMYVRGCSRSINVSLLDAVLVCLVCFLTVLYGPYSLQVVHGAEPRHARAPAECREKRNRREG